MQHDQGSHFILARNKRRIGPFTYEQVKQMATAGAIQPTDMLLQEGQLKWQAACEIKSLFPVHNADLAVKRPPERCYMNPLQPGHWYLAKNKQRLGPFTAEQLMQMAATGMIQPSDMVLEEGKQKWSPINEVLAPIQVNRKPRVFKRIKLVGLSTAAATLMLVFGLWAIGLFGFKPSQPEPVQQAQAESKKDNPRNSQKDEPSQKGNPASIPGIPKPGAEKEGPAASGQEDKSAGEEIGNDGQDQKKTEPPKQARAKRLASIREHNKAKLHTIATEIAKLNKELARLDKLLAAKSGRDLPPDERQRLRTELEKRQAEAKKRESPGQLPTLIVEDDVLVQRRHEWAKERANALQLLLIAEKKLIEAHQEERKLLAHSPEAGDPSFVEHDGLLYTKDELFHNLFAVPFRYGTLSQVTGSVVDVSDKSLAIRYSLLLLDRRPGRRLRPPGNTRSTGACPHHGARSHRH